MAHTIKARCTKPVREGLKAIRDHVLTTMLPGTRMLPTVSRALDYIDHMSEWQTPARNRAPRATTRRRRKAA